MSDEDNNYSKGSNKTMIDDIIMINEDDTQVRSSAAIFKSTVGLTIHNGVLCAVFSTVENRKGYGKQFIPVTELEQVMAVLTAARDNGIVSENEVKTTSQIVRSSLIENDEGEIRFKTEATKGKKPTLCSDKGDFDGFVSALEEYTPKIISKAEKVRSKISK